MARAFASRPGALAGLLVGVLLLLAAAGAASAQTRDPFAALMVPVDATAKDANLARANALVAGYRAGLAQVFERLVLAADYDRLPDLSDARIAQMISGFEILNERVSSTRYLADLNVSFKPDEVRLELRNAAVRFAESVSRPVLLLPVLEARGAPRLWDELNPWRDAWSLRPTGGGLVPLPLPLGDQIDVMTLGAEQALLGEVEGLQRIAARYDAKEALVAAARPRFDIETGAPRLDVTLIRPGEGESPQTLSFAGEPGGDGWAAVFAAAVTGVARHIDEAWKRVNLLEFDQERSVEVELAIASLEDWLDIRRRLEAVSVVQRVDLLALSQRHASLRLRYLGEPEGFAFSLRQAELDLERTPEGWVLRRTESSAGAPEAP